jgi:hypothetical protein
MEFAENEIAKMQEIRLFPVDFSWIVWQTDAILNAA